jgi:hypothetical protein
MAFLIPWKNWGIKRGSKTAYWSKFFATYN